MRPVGKFDGILMLCDLDDTFRGAEGTVERHTEAIRYFTENGGRFSFATGRGASYMKRQAFFSLVNAPGSFYNGGYVYDFSADAFLRKSFLPFTVGQFTDSIQQYNLPIAQLHIPADEFVCAEGREMFSLPKPTRDFVALKMVARFEKPEDAAHFQELAKTVPLLQTCSVARCWNVGVEINAADGTKGHGLDFIKACLGDIHTTVGVGNYDNDIPLICHADIGVAVGNAPQHVKQAADLVVRACDDFGLCQLVEILENR